MNTYFKAQDLDTQESRSLVQSRSVFQPKGRAWKETAEASREQCSVLWILPLIIQQLPTLLQHVPQWHGLQGTPAWARDGTFFFPFYQGVDHHGLGLRQPGSGLMYCAFTVLGLPSVERRDTGPWLPEPRCDVLPRGCPQPTRSTPAHSPGLLPVVKGGKGRETRRNSERFSQTCLKQKVDFSVSEFKHATYSIFSASDIEQHKPQFILHKTAKYKTCQTHVSSFLLVFCFVSFLILAVTWIYTTPSLCGPGPNPACRLLV